jgi:hypothetical protein
MISAVVVTTVSLGLVAAVASPANAGTWVFADGFENNPAASWWFENPDIYSHGDFGGYDGVPHSGNAYATLYRFEAGWNSVDHSLSLPSGFFVRSCAVGAWFEEAAGTRFNIEIIDPTTWTYVALGQFTVNSTGTWQSNSISWSGGPNNVVLRFVVVSNGGFARIKIDDVVADCITL